MERLRHIREQAGYSQQDLADESGVSQHTISEIELGRRKPQGRTLRKLAKALGVEVADFYGESTYPKEEAPPSLQPSFNGLLEEERREAIYQPWLDFVNRYADRWEQRIAAGDFDLGAFNEFNATFEDLALTLSRLGRQEQREQPPRAIMDEAMMRLQDLLDPLLEAAVAKFEESELDQLRRRRETMQRSLGRSA